MNGDETLTSGSLSIGGNTKIVDGLGATLTTGLSGLVNVEFNSSGQTFTLGEDLSYITGNVTVASGTTLDVSTFTATVPGTSDVNGILNINGSGVFDANGTFDATNGNITFTGAGRLQLGGTVTSLGTLTELTGTVEYDGGAQNVYAENYYNLEIDGTGDKTLSGNTTISNQLFFQRIKI